MKNLLPRKCLFVYQFHVRLSLLENASFMHAAYCEPSTMKSTFFAYINMLRCSPVKTKAVSLFLGHLGLLKQSLLCILYYFYCLLYFLSSILHFICFSHLQKKIPSQPSQYVSRRRISIICDHGGGPCQRPQKTTHTPGIILFCFCRGY